MEDIDVESLISLVEARPVLWDKTRDDYKDKQMKIEAWKEVFENLFPDFGDQNRLEKTKLGNSVVKKWTGIKDNYMKYVKKLQEFNKSGAAATKVKEYHLYKRLHFFNKNTQNKMDSSATGGKDQTEAKNKQIQKRKSTTPTRYVAPRKNKMANPIEEEITSNLQQPENRHLSFFKAILPSLDKLNDNQTLIFQSRVLQILTDLCEPPHRYPRQSGYSTPLQGNYGRQRPQSASTVYQDYEAAQMSSQNASHALQTSPQSPHETFVTHGQTLEDNESLHLSQDSIKEE